MFYAQFILLLPLIHSVFGHKCYVCAPDHGKPEDLSQLKRAFPDVKIPLCSQYKSELQHQYLMECPPDSKGCLTKFEENGSIMRTCQKYGIEDCKVANSINYCYCSQEGCNTPDPELSSSEGWKSDISLPRQGHEIHFSAPSIQHPPMDDEDSLEEGSADEDWGSFYYDSYYDTTYDNKNNVWHNYDAGVDFGLDDMEPGFGGEPDGMTDMTEPPPYIELEKELENIAVVSKFDRGGGEPENEIIFVEETVTARPGSLDTTAGTANKKESRLLLCLICVLCYWFS